MNDEEETTYRITRTTAACMVTVAFIFDVLQVAAKMLTLLGLTVLTGIIAVLACNYLGIDAPKFCAVVGVGTGAVVSLTGIGTAIALKVGMIMDWLASVLLVSTGYATMMFWFLKSDVPLFGGKKPAGRVAAFFFGLLVDFLPFLNILPGLTVWTIRMIYTARSEDKEKAKEARARYTGKNFSRMRRPLRRTIQEPEEEYEYPYAA